MKTQRNNICLLSVLDKLISSSYDSKSTYGISKVSILILFIVPRTACQFPQLMLIEQIASIARDQKPYDVFLAFLEKHVSSGIKKSKVQ